ncbi:hypothetical protein TrRE_jg2126 [Triparma retinervis]|uniref:Uncharacterized protein n=1 Tax=Triparma retinervis TaxID=2557542 RepID=A0A9W7AEJ7_9STRA|nr:hypothetical protein TrRE_jg2126 [Triparma retinervis]
MAIPGNSVLEQTFIGGFMTFLQLYNYVITGRILLSWFPQSQGVAVLQPIFVLSDPFLNTFRGLVPSIGGIDLSPLLGFFLLNVLTNATAAIGCEGKGLKGVKGAEGKGAVRGGRGGRFLFS